MSIRYSIVTLLVAASLGVACGKKSGSQAPPSPRDGAGQHLDAATPPPSTWSDPPRVDGPPRATQLTLGSNFGCARMSDDTMRCWGGNDWGQLGSELAPPPAGTAATPDIDGVVEVAAGYAFTCARKRDHSVWCWGYDLYGELGKADQSMSGTPVPIAGIDDAVGLAAGDRTIYVVRSDGSVWAWGDNTYRQLGDGSATARKGPVRTRVDGAVAVMGGMGGCARRLDDTLWCWGMNLPDDPAPVAVGAPVADAAIGGVFCAITTSGEVRCWGHDDSGQLGRADASTNEDFINEPAPVAGLRGATRVASSSDHACAIAGGKVWCWGAKWANPAFPATCLRMTTHSGGGGAPAQWEYCPVATEVPDISGAVDVDVMDHAGGCAIDGEGRVWCWGPEAPAQITL